MDKRESARLRKRKSRKNQKLQELNRDWLRGELESYYSQNEIPREWFVPAEQFFNECKSPFLSNDGGLFQVSKDSFLGLMMKGGSKNLKGTEVITSKQGGEVVQLLRPKLIKSRKES